MPTKDLARLLKRTVASVYNAADVEGLKKSETYLASPAACRLRRGDKVGAATRFPPGHAPANKGLRRPGWAPGRMAATQFSKGQMPHNWHPVGHERLTKEGYLQRKMADTGNTVADYVEVHRLLWEERHGPIPIGLVLVFKDRNKTNIVLENLELITRRELMARNSVHRLPKELADLIQLNGALKRKLRNLSEKQNVGSSQPSL
jgi:hypothetical protein